MTGSPASPPEAVARDAAGARTRDAGFIIALLAILALAAALRLWNAGADPPLTLSRSNSEITDGPWYLDAAVRRARGLPTDAFDAARFRHYTKPLITGTALPFLTSGVSLERAHAWAAAWGVALVGLGVGAAWTAWGAGTAALAGLLLAAGFVFVGYGRVTVVYGPLAACLLGVLWLFLAGGRRRAVEVAALALLAAVALLLKENAVVMAPALVVAMALRARSPARVLVVLLGVIAPLGLVLVWWLEPRLVELALGKLRGYVAGAGAFDTFKRWLRTPFSSGIVAKAPLVCVFGWLGVLAACARQGQPAAGEAPRDAPDRARTAEVVLAVWMVSWFAFHGVFEYLEGGPPPMRHMLGGLVPAALLAARMLGRLGARAGLVLRVHPAALFLWALLGAYWALGAGWTLAWPALAPASGPAPGWLRSVTGFAGLAVSAAAVAALTLAWAWRGSWAPRLRLPAWGGAVLVVLALGLSAWRLVPMVASPTWSLRQANRAVAELVADGARLYGPWAHALSWDAPRVSRHIPPHEVGEILQRSTRMTHLVIDWGWTRDLLRQYAHNGIQPVLLERVRVRGHPIGIFRYPWAERLGYRLSPRERALVDASGNAPGDR